MSQVPSNEQTIFEQAQRIESLDEQAEYVARMCGDDAQMMKRIRDRLRKAEKKRDVNSDEMTMDSPVIGLDDPTRDSDFTTAKPTDHPSSVPPGTIIAGRYKLLENIAEGGMGSVWVAQQSQPVKRKVAIKLIKPGMDSKQVLARFDAERQALALMEHPNIAQVFDGGLTDQGRPFFAMEYVKGIPLTEYCNQQRLTVNERLELFVVICQAVQHAHQKGIVHRDLKPSNILVGNYGGKPVPKVIDFGLAKAMDQSLTEQSIYTAHGMVVGTPLYMSPEQARSDNLDIDTRADIYSLGVLLYEVLTGSTPLEKKQFKDVAATEIMRLIREFDPPKPSTRLSSSESLPSVAAERKIDPAHLKREVSGDLDWVVMKALEKERDRRYETANGLAADILRHLNDEPVVASPPSRRYRMQKFVKRNRASVIAVSLVFASLVLGVIGTSVGLLWALSENERANQATTAETKAKVAALASADEARESEKRALEATNRERERADELKEVSRFQAKMLINLNPTLVGAELMQDLQSKYAQALTRLGVDDGQERAKKTAAFEKELAVVNSTDAAADLIDRTILKPALIAIEERFQNQPLVDAALRQTLANLYREIGKYKEALPLQKEVVEVLTNAIGENHPDSLAAKIQLGWLYDLLGNRILANKFIRESLEQQQGQLDQDNPKVAFANDRMGTLLSNEGNYEDAEPYFAEALAGYRQIYGDDHPDTLDTMNNVGRNYQLAGKYQQAEPYLREALATSQRVLGEDDVRTLLYMSNLASLTTKQGNFTEAAELHGKLVEKRRRVLGNDHPMTINSIHNMAFFLQNAKRSEEAVPYYKEALEKSRRIHGETHKDTLINLANLGRAYIDLGQYDQADPIITEVLEKFRKHVGANHPNTINTLHILAQLRKGQQRYAEGIEAEREAISKAKFAFRPQHPFQFSMVQQLGQLLELNGEFEEAEKSLRQAYEGFSESLGEKHPSTTGALKSLLNFYTNQKLYTEAEPLHVTAVEWARADTPVNAARLSDALVQQGVNWLELDKSSKSKTAFKECLDLRRTALGEDSRLVNSARSLLGQSIAAQQRFAEAEPLLVESATWFRSNVAEPGASDVFKANEEDAVRRVIELYENWHLAEPDQGFNDKAEEWKKK